MRWLPSFRSTAPALQGASVLVVGRNFGCGSSREHAVWAVQQAGFRALIAPGQNEGFADIFEQNALNNGVLPIELPDESWKTIAAAAGAEVTIDLERQRITLHTAPEARIPFEVPETSRQRLLRGLDAIAETLLQDAAIRVYERQMPPWVVPNLA